MIIRPAREADVFALQTLLRNSWLTIWAPNLQFATVQRWAAADPAGSYAREMWRLFIVADDGVMPRGMFHIEGAHVHALHVDHRHKRHRIGSLLMDEAERRIAAAGHNEATLETDTFNMGAIAFYERRGWKRSAPYETLECGEPVQTCTMTKALGA